MTALTAFLAGERPADIAIYLSEAHLQNADALGDHAERVDGGYLLVLDGERGRRVFAKVAGDAPMEFAQEATKREGTVDRDLTGGECPDAGADTDEHAPRFVLAFAQEQTDDVGGLYEEGDVIHAYARCACGTAYSDRWLVDEGPHGA